MSNFNPHITVEGIGAQINYDNVIYIVANDPNTSLITFRGGETLIVNGTLNMEWPYGDKSLMYEDS